MDIFNIHSQIVADYQSYIRSFIRINPQAITLQLRHEVPTEVDIAATSFKASVVLTPADALAIAGELLTVAAVQVRSKG
jgi:hypothetical protein